MEKCEDKTVDKKTVTNRKRNRPEGSQNAKDEDKDDSSDVVCLQTPHTLRLLKLIQEGTLEHARIAASHLASLSASPIVLWDLLGRLQAFLLSPQWSTRLHASLAMQGVAQHIPPSDQREFLEATYSGPLWLTVDEVSQGLDTILAEGRVLLSECDTKEDSFASQEDRLKRLDDNQKELQEDFVEQRVRLQREILAQRLGLGGVVQAIGGSVLSDAITKEDLLMNDNERKHQPVPQKRINKRQRPDESDDYDSGSIRALLVMEMQQQQDRTAERGATSHKNPQRLLATELIYRMFDPSWHVRHGAFLGTLSLLRAWKGVVGEHSFGMWPHDILARCLCALSLDRFGDYGGTSLGDDSSTGEGVIAPVREMAGQLLSVLWTMAPVSIQRDCLAVLLRMSSREEWEVRHGALLALKYIVVMLLNDVLDGRNDESLRATVKEISQVAKERLSDKMEDVQSVSAQVLLTILSSTQKGDPQRVDLIKASCLPLWGALGQLRSISSCAVDFVGLFSSMVCADCTVAFNSLEPSLGEGPCVLRSVADKLMEFLDYDSTAVNVSALIAIGRIAAPIKEMVVVGSGVKRNVSDMLARSYCSLLERIFFSYTVGRYAATPHGDDKGYESFCANRCTVWKLLVASAAPVLQACPSQRNNLLVGLISSYMQVQHHSTGRIAGMLNAGSADALARLLDGLNVEDGSTDGNLNSFLEAFFGLLLNSPWTEHCEHACLLYQALNSYGYPLLRGVHALLQQFFEEGPLCLNPNIAELSSAILSKPSVVSSVDRVLLSELTRLLSNDEGHNKREQERFWHSALHLDGRDHTLSENGSGPSLVNTSSMRVHAMISGAIVSGGQENLPSRLTPLVRALMTSMKSEPNRERQTLTCENLAQLLKTLSCSDNESHLRVKVKVVENVCIMLSSGSSPETQGGHRSQAAENVICLLVAQLPHSKTLASIPPIWNRLRLLMERHHSAVEDASLLERLHLLSVICRSLKRGDAATRHLIENLMRPLVPIACTYRDSGPRTAAANVIVSLCQKDPVMALDTSLPVMLAYLRDKDSDPRRLGSLRLLQLIIEGIGIEVCPFVRCLLPITMSLMTDPLEDCAKQAAQSFAALVRVSPLVKETVRRQWEVTASQDHSDEVIDHLIHGKPLPPCVLADPIAEALKEAAISLRDYQMEGITWLQFLQQVKLNGILADDMGLGKTLQALTAVVLSHQYLDDAASRPVSLVVCPSTLVGHWLAEIRKFFPRRTLFRGTSDIGYVKQWNEAAVTDEEANIVVVSYSVLRREVKALSKINWHYCILDEGHLLKNPKTATAVSARKLQARHKLILTGTPVQNRVHELWAAFDFLMPNFLGSQSWFSRNFARPICNSQLQGATAESISTGMETLKLLHQQVLPFILRREKDQVMKELPPKCITDMPCSLSSEQQELYESFCHGSDARRAVAALQSSIKGSTNGNKEPTSQNLSGEALKSLLYLRLLCTHPSLVKCENDVLPRFDSSGKLKVLNELLRTARVCGEELTAADNDASALYADLDEKDSIDDASELLSSNGDVPDAPFSCEVESDCPKCLIFAQFTQSLDVVEQSLFQTQMPSLRYLRLDGSVPPAKRGDIVEAFNRDDSIKVMLLTSRVGSLGLNLTGASVVIFLEHDYNPHADLQAMDRAHRIGQTKTVNVYRLITQNTIEEKIMKLQETKMAMSKAIVNAENSTMYSMGTDRLLDIFTFRSNDSSRKGSKSTSAQSANLEALEEQYSGEDYASLSVNAFIDGFRNVQGNETANDDSR